MNTHRKIKNFKNAVEASMFHSSMLLNMMESCEKFLDKSLKEEENNDLIKRDLIKFLIFLSDEKKCCEKDFDFFLKLHKTIKSQCDIEKKKRCILGVDTNSNNYNNRKRKINEEEENEEEKNEEEGEEEVNEEVEEEEEERVGTGEKELKSMLRNNSNACKKPNNSTFFIAPSISVLIPNKLSVLFSDQMKDSNLSKLFKISCLVFKMFNMEELFIEKFQRFLYQCQVDLKEKKPSEININTIKANNNNNNNSLKNGGRGKNNANDNNIDRNKNKNSDALTEYPYSVLRLSRRFVERLGNKFSETSFDSRENMIMRHLENFLELGEGSAKNIINSFLSSNLDMSIPGGKGKERLFIPTGSGITNEKLIIYVISLLKSLRTLLYTKGIHYSLNDENFIALIKLVYNVENAVSMSEISRRTADAKGASSSSSSSTTPKKNSCCSSSSSSSAAAAAAAISNIDPKCVCYCHILYSGTKTEYFPNAKDKRDIEVKIQKLERIPQIAVQYGKNGLKNKRNILHYGLAFVINKISETSSNSLFNVLPSKSFNVFLEYCVEFIFKNSSFTREKLYKVCREHLRFLDNLNQERGNSSIINGKRRKKNKNKNKKSNNNNNNSEGEEEEEDEEFELFSEYTNVFPKMDTKIKKYLKNIEERQWQANMNLLKKGCNIVGKTSKVFKFSSKMLPKIRLNILNSSFLNTLLEGINNDDIKNDDNNDIYDDGDLLLIIENLEDKYNKDIEYSKLWRREIEIIISDRHISSLEVKISPSFFTNGEYKEKE